MTRWNPEPAVTRILNRIVIDPHGCWLWPGSANGSGYGHARDDDGRLRVVHRIIFEATNGPVPDGLVLDHLCRQRLCVNPDHIEPVTHQVNILRGESPMARSVRTDTCRFGHPLTQERVQRVCRVCRAARMRAARRNKKASA